MTHPPQRDRTAGNRPGRWFLICAVVVMMPLAISAATFLFIAGLPETYLDKDISMMELYTLHAARGQQMVGPYSRFGWNHPGPALFYALVPLYQLSGKNASSLFLSARLMNLACIGLVLAALWIFLRKRDWNLLWCSIALLPFYLSYIGALRLASPWNPDIILLPLLLFTVLAAAFSVGNAYVLPLLLAVGSLVVQSHVGSFPCVLAITGVSFALFAVERGRGVEPLNRSSARAVWIWALLSLALLAAMWALPIREELQQSPGNLEKLYAFFVSPPKGYQFSDAFLALAQLMSWLPLLLLRSLPVDIPRFEYEVIAGIFAPAQLGLLVWSCASALRRRQRFRAYLGLLAAAGGMAAFWSATRITGDIFAYLLYWVSALGLVSWWVIGAGVLEAVVCRAGDEPIQGRMRFVPGLVFLLALAASAPQILPAIRGSLDPPGHTEKVKRLSQPVIQYLKAHDVKQPLILFDWSNWSLEVGVITQLYKANIGFCVENTWLTHKGGWPLFFPDRCDSSVPRRKQIRFEGEPPADVSRGTCIARYGGTSVWILDSNP